MKPIFPANMTDDDIAAKWEGFILKLTDKEGDNDDNKHDEESKDSDNDDDKKDKEQKKEEEEEEEGSDTDSGTDPEDRKRKQKILEDTEEAIMPPPQKKRLEKMGTEDIEPWDLTKSDDEDGPRNTEAESDTVKKLKKEMADMKAVISNQQETIKAYKRNAKQHQIVFQKRDLECKELSSENREFEKENEKKTEIIKRLKLEFKRQDKTTASHKSKYKDTKSKLKDMES